MWEYKNTRKKKIPDRSDQQKEVNRAKRATLYRKHRDDESFFTKTHSTINGNDNFYSDNIGFSPAKVKLKRKHEYDEKKLFIWIAMSTRGISSFTMSIRETIPPICLKSDL